MFAALAASGLMGSSTKPQGDVAPVTKPSSPNPPADASSSISSSAQTTAQRRRSQRLAKQTHPASASSEISANNSNTDDAKESTSFDTFETPSSAGATIVPSELVPSEMVVDTELQAEFSDDEDVDAEVFDGDIDPDNSISEKTINLSIVEGSWSDIVKCVLICPSLDGSKIEAQTPDGTRVGTPNVTSKDGLQSVVRNLHSSRTSYAAALKAKPTDWHLEFSMDDHILPLDLTIYGAIHQHELRKKSGATPLNLIWQGIYTIKFKKVSGPPPSSPESEYRSWILHLV